MTDEDLKPHCFVGHSCEAKWRDDILSACADVLPGFSLEPWYAADHFVPTKPLRSKVVEMILKSHYGIYDLSSWRDRSGEWHLPRNVFVELGMAAVLNRPALLLRHTSNEGLLLPACLQGMPMVTFAGESTLKKAMQERLPQWFDIPPERDWLNRFCILGNRVCHFREEHPRACQLGQDAVHCHISDGLDKGHPSFNRADREEFRESLEGVLGRYGQLEFAHLDELRLADGYQFAMCSLCQAVRSASFALYRILPSTPADTFVAIGMSIGLEAFFEYDIPNVIVVQEESQLPTLLRGYEVVEASSSTEVKRRLKTSIPAVVAGIRAMAWKPRPLPFVEITPDVPTELQQSTEDRWTWVTHPPDGLMALLQRVLADAIKLVRADAGAILLPDVAPNKLRVAVAAGQATEQREILEISANRGITGWVAQHQKHANVPDVTRDARYVVWHAGVQSEIAVPLLAGNELVGVLDLESLRLSAFGRDDARHLEELAAAAAQAISAERSRVREAQRQRWLQEIREGASSTRELRSLLTTIAEVAVQSTGADAAVLFPYDSSRQRFYSPEGLASRGSAESLPPLVKPNMRGLASRVMREGLIAVSDPEQQDLLDLEVRSFAGVALKHDNVDLGVLYVDYRTPHQFEDAELEWLGMLASQASEAILQSRTEEPEDGLGGHAKDILRLGPLLLDVSRNTLSTPNGEIQVTLTLLRLLVLFMRNAGRVLTRDEILEQVWGADIGVNDNALESAISRLRRHIEPDPRNPRYLRTVRGVGYRLDVP